MKTKTLINNETYTKGKWDIMPDTLDRFHIAANGRIIATINTDIAVTQKSNEDEANAYMICKAVNNHEALLSALKEIERCFNEDNYVFRSEQKEAIRLAQEAIKKAEESI